MIESYDFSKGKGMKVQKVQKYQIFLGMCVERVESYYMIQRVRVEDWLKRGGGVFTNYVPI